MILHTMKLRGLSVAFPREVAIDFAQVPDGLTAIVGGNGAGKTTLIEAMCAALYRTFPSYGETVAEHVAPGTRDAFAELVFELHGTIYRALVQADPAFGGGRGKTEAYLSRLEGETWTPIAGPLVRDFDEAIATILPSREVFLASVFACQGGDGSFFGLAKSARKDLFSELLGVGHLQALSETARGRAQDVLGQLERAREDLAAATARAGRVADLVAALDAARTAHAEVDAALATQRERQEAAQAAVTSAREELARLESAAQQQAAERARLSQARDAAHQRIGQAQARIEEADRLLAGAEAIRAAAAALPEIEQTLAGYQREIDETTALLRPLEAELGGLEERRRTLLEEHARRAVAAQEATAAAGRVAQGEAIAAAAAEKARERETATAALDVIGRELPEVERDAETERATLERRARLETRRADLAPRRTLLGRIPGVPACGECPLTADARKAQDDLAAVDAELAALPQVVEPTAQARLATLLRARDEHRAAIAVLDTWQARNAAALARLDTDRLLAADVDARTAAVADIVTAGTQLRGTITAKRAEQTRLQTTLDELIQRRQAHEARRAQLAADAAKLPAIADAEARREDALRTRGQGETDAQAADTALAALVVVDVEPARIAVQQADAARFDVEAALRDVAARAEQHAREVARLEGEHAALGDPDADVETLRRKEAALAIDAADWALLERSLGRDGVQALAIDAAGPAVTAIANDLLASCYGPRFQLALETTAMSKDGKKQKEVFDVRILDGEAGREAKRGSGGEQVVLDTALRLAIALFNAQRSGYALRTLWLDETTGALSPENADRYVAMLRRAMHLGGFVRCLFIAHQPSVWEQADARLVVHGGTVTLEGQEAAA